MVALRPHTAQAVLGGGGGFRSGSPHPAETPGKKLSLWKMVYIFSVCECHLSDEFLAKERSQNHDTIFVFKSNSPRLFRSLPSPMAHIYFRPVLIILYSFYLYIPSIFIGNFFLQRRINSIFLYRMKTQLCHQNRKHTI